MTRQEYIKEQEAELEIELRHAIKQKNAVSLIKNLVYDHDFHLENVYSVYYAAIEIGISEHNLFAVWKWFRSKKRKLARYRPLETKYDYYNMRINRLRIDERFVERMKAAAKWIERIESVEIAPTCHHDAGCVPYDDAQRLEIIDIFYNYFMDSRANLTEEERDRLDFSTPVQHEKITRSNDPEHYRTDEPIF